MYSTQKKSSTLRSARAVGVLNAAPETIAAIREGRVPKGNVIELARAAGVMSGKRTFELIPYCHPICLDQVLVDFELSDTQVTVTCEVTLVGKTGPEMEALTGCTLALLTLYDMLKPLDKNMVITDVKLAGKKGGKSSFKDKPFTGMRLWVIVTSDSTAAGKREDKSGKVIVDHMRALGLAAEQYIVLPDEKEQIKATLLKAADEKVDLVLSTGGTGLGPRDVTVEAAQEVITREAPGVVEAMRGYGQQRTPYAMLSRGVAGLRGDTLILTLPGSSRGAQECLDALFPALFHAWPMMRGGGHEEEGKKKP